MNKKNIAVFARGAIILALTSVAYSETVGIFYDGAYTGNQVDFAAQEISNALKKQGDTPDIKPISDLSKPYTNKKIVLGLRSNALIATALSSAGISDANPSGEQTYALRTTSQPALTYWVIGGDIDGIMYGGLDVSENIKPSLPALPIKNVTPTVLRRGSKLNLPMDRRLPTYSGSFENTSMQLAINHVWDMNFWKDWIDTQARNRMNMLTIWLHNPFPAMIDTPDFPLAALPRIEDYSGAPIPETDSVTKRENFWKGVMSYAKNRGFLFYIYTWNITPEYAKDQYPGVILSGSGNTASSTVYNSSKTQEYYKKSVRKMYETYPDLSGIGVSPGDEMDTNKKQDNTNWVAKTYGAAAVEFANSKPDRSVKIIHRVIKAEYENVKASNTDSQIFRDLKLPSGPTWLQNNVQFDFSLKHCWAQVYSSTNPKWTSGDLAKLAADERSTYLTCRNDGLLYNDFGDINFIRQFVSNLPSKAYPSGKPRLRGIYLGPDTMSPSASFMYRDDTLNRKDDDPNRTLLEVERKWYSETAWGRICYDNTVNDNVFHGLLAKKYPDLASKASILFDAWGLASKPLPGFVEQVYDTWKLDSGLMTEFTMGRSAGVNLYRSVKDVSSTKTPVFSNYYSLSDITPSTIFNKAGKIAPLELANQMMTSASQALEKLALLTPDAKNTRTKILLENIRQSALLSKFYSAKLKAAFELKTTNRISELTILTGECYSYWMEYVNSMEQIYVPMITNTYDLTVNGGFHQFDNEILAEYTAFVPNKAYVVQETTNGILKLQPATWTYNNNTSIKATAVPLKGYKFVGWKDANGNLTADSAITIDVVVNGRTTLRPVFAIDLQSRPVDKANINEQFSLSNGTKSFSSTYAWVAQRSSGNFEVKDGKLLVSGNGTEGTFETSTMDISGGIFKASIKLEANGGPGSNDYIRFIKVVDGNETIIKEYKGDVPGVAIMEDNNITGGSRLKLKIVTNITTSGSYALDDLVLTKTGTTSQAGTYTLTESSPGGFIKFTPAGPIYSAGTKVTVEAIPDPGNRFVKWTQLVSGTSPIAEIIINANSTVAAEFAPVTQVNYTLTESSPGGFIKFTPAGPTYPAGTKVTVEALPAPGNRFVKWTQLASGTSPTAELIINANSTVAAEFAPVTQVNYTLTESSPGGFIKFTPAGPTYPAGTKVTVEAIPDLGNRFIRWTKAASGTSLTAEITINADTQVIGEFGPSIPLPWVTQDIGYTSSLSAAYYSTTASEWTLTGLGRDIWTSPDISTPPDQFRFVHQKASNPSKISTYVSQVTMSPMASWSRTGVMMRSSLNEDASYAMICVTGGNGIRFQSRASDKVSPVLSLASPGNRVAPVWLKLERIGNEVKGYQSPTGLVDSWVLVGSASIQLDTQIFTGLLVSSGNASIPCTSIFKNVTVEN